MISRIVGVLAALILLQACPGPQKQTVATDDSLGGPTPGPIIDTSGGAGDTTLEFRYDTVPITASTGDTGKLDPLLVDAKTRSGILVDCPGKKVNGLKKDRVVTYTFSDGEWFSVKISDWNSKVVWTCSKAGGNPNVKLTAGSSGIPDCMTTKGGTRSISKVETDNGKNGNVLIIHTQK